MTAEFGNHAAMSKEALPMIGRMRVRRNLQTTARSAYLDATEQIGAAIERTLH